jgi:hypothetical protein
MFFRPASSSKLFFLAVSRRPTFGTKKTQYFLSTKTAVSLHNRIEPLFIASFWSLFGRKWVPPVLRCPRRPPFLLVFSEARQDTVQTNALAFDSRARPDPLQTVADQLAVAALVLHQLIAKPQSLAPEYAPSFPNSSGDDANNLYAFRASIHLPPSKPPKIHITYLELIKMLRVRT